MNIKEKEELRKKYKDSFIQSDFFLHQLDLWICQKENMFGIDGLKTEEEKQEENKSIKSVMDRMDEYKKSEEHKLATTVINQMQNAYNTEVISQNYDAFRTFSLDASDLTILQQIEDTVNWVYSIDKTDKEAVKQGIKTVEKHIKMLNGEIDKAKTAISYLQIEEQYD